MLSARQLAFLAVVTLLPVVAFAAVTLSILEQRERAALEEHLRQTARTAADTIERQIAQELAALATLASAEALDRGDLPAFRVQARRAVRVRPNWLSVALYDRERQLMNTRLPDGETVPGVIDPAGVAAVYDSGRPQVSGVMRRPEWQPAPFVALRTPVMRDGRVVASLNAAVSAWTFNAILKSHVAGEGGRLALIDGNHRFIARAWSDGPEDPLLGTEATDSVLDGMRAGTDRVYEGTHRDGERFLMTTAAVPGTGWIVMASAPQRVVMEPLWRSRLYLYGGATAALTLAALLGSALIAAFTRRQEAERRLAALEADKAAQRRLADIAANFPGVIFRRVQQPDGRMAYPYVSDSVVSFLGYPPEYFQGRTFDPAEIAGLMAPDTVERWTAAVARSAGTLEPLRLEGAMIDARGRHRCFRLHASTWREKDGSVVWDGVLLDITDLHEAERARREGEDRLAFALEGARAGLWDWDIPAGRFTWSDHVWRLFGYDRPAGEPSLDVIDRVLHPEDRDLFRSAFRHAADHGTPLSVEFRVVHPGGEVRWIGATGRTYVDAEGRAVRMTGIDIDITDRKRIEEQLNHAKEEAERANIAKSKFLAAASHDLRQPVQSLLFFAHVLSERLGGHSARELVGTMQQALDALKGLLDGILDLSKLDAGVIVPQREALPVGALLRRLGAEYEPRFAQKGLRLRVRDCDAMVDSDPTLLGRIVGNLLDNALKYTRGGGVLVGCRRRGAELRIEVWDTGLGIPEGRLTEIFDEFVQIGNPERDRTQGLGLGLAIVKRLARLLGHPLSVRSAPGRGSLFRVTVPLARQHQPAGQPALHGTPAAVEPVGDLAVVIDDEAIILEGMQAMLETWGYRVVAADEVDAALDWLARTGQRPDVVVADFRLRDGRTGVDAIHALRAAWGADLPGILLTGDTGPDLQVLAERDGFTILHKPVQPGALRRLMHDALRPSRAGAARQAGSAAD